MNLRLYLRQLRHQLPVWPLKTLRMLIQTLFRGNSKYYLVMIFCIFMILFTSHKQRSTLISREEVAGNKLVRDGLKSNEADDKSKVKEGTCSDFPPMLVGNLTINPNITPNFDEVYKIAGKALMKGGCYHPSNCDPLQQVAIIIPFKDREAHLRTLLYYLHPILMRQRAYYCVFVAEQFDNGQFNKAMIMNAAFEEVLKIGKYDCIIFHDVDMIPENDKNLYLCGSQPRHLSPAIDKFRYKPHYGTEFGGVTAITPSQYRKANGHSNEYWGWGGEDNDMEYRIRYNGMKIVPSSLGIGRYKMIVHYHPWSFKPGDYPHSLNKTREIRATTDGLSDLRYRMLDKIAYRSFTKLMIDIRRIEVKKITMFVDGKKAMDVDLPPKGKCRYVAYEGKYLLSKLDLTRYEEANKYRPPPEKLDVPKHIAANMSAAHKNSGFSLIKTYDEAEELCEKMHPECQGIQAEINNMYSLRKGGVPRNLVVTVADKPQILQNGKVSSQPKRYIFPAKTAYFKYCPGTWSLQKYEEQLVVDTKLNKSLVQHNYSLEIEFSILIKPSRYLYYIDTKLLEGEEKVHKNFYTLKWPDGGKPPNFNLPQTPKDYVFKTIDFPFPNIPGCYGIESKIVSNLQHPYFQWNWWIDVTSGDKIEDSVVRSTYWKNLNRARAHNSQKLALQRHIKQQKRKEYGFAKRMAELHGNPFEINPELEGDDEISMRDIAEIVDKGVDTPQFILKESDYLNPEIMGVPQLEEKIQVQKQKEPGQVRARKQFHPGV